MTNKSALGKIISALFGIVFFAIGVINTFWGNDPVFGVFILFLSLVYFSSANTVFRKWTGFSIHPIIKIFPGIFVFWAALGVGELFGKIEMMKQDLFKN